MINVARRRQQVGKKVLPSSEVSGLKFLSKNWKLLRPIVVRLHVLLKKLSVVSETWNYSKFPHDELLVSRQVRLVLGLLIFASREVGSVQVFPPKKMKRQQDKSRITSLQIKFMKGTVIYRWQDYRHNEDSFIGIQN